MRLIGGIVLACLLMGLLRYAIIALVLALLLTIMVSLVTRPGETLGMFCLFAIVAVLQVHPLTGLLVVLGLCCWAKRTA